MRYLSIPDHLSIISVVKFQYFQFQNEKKDDLIKSGPRRSDMFLFFTYFALKTMPSN